MTLVFSNPIFQQHLTGQHPERPSRLDFIANSEFNQEHSSCFAQPEFCKMASLDQIKAIHKTEQIAAAEAICRNGGGYLDADTICSEKSYEVALTAVGTVIGATEKVVSDETGNALCLVRPPGHHATQNTSMGFCLFNSVAIAADHAIKSLDLDRVMIVDWDVHHGNGTQDIFYDRDDVFFMSAHRYPFYPGSGDSCETGSGRGLGYTKNVPIEYGTSRKEYIDKFTRALEQSADKFKPELILISAGFDAHKADPVGSLGLETEDFGTLTNLVMDVASNHCGNKIVSCLEGGYDLVALAASVDTHLNSLKAPLI